MELDAALLAFERGALPAREAADALFRAFPERPEARAVAVVARVGAGDLAAARIIALGENGSSLAARGLFLVHDGDLTAGTASVERSLLLAPNDPFVIGVAAGVIGMYDPEQALRLARRCVELRPHDPGSYARLLPSLTALEEWDKIAALLNDPPAAFAGSPSHTRLRAIDYRNKGDSVKAQAVARELVAQTPDGAGAWALLATLLNNEDQRAEADSSALHALDLNPRQPDALLVLARSAEARGDNIEAERLRDARRRAMPLAEALKPLTDLRTLHREKKYEELIRLMDRFEELPPFARNGALRRRIRLLTVMKDDAALRRAVETAPFDDDYTAAGRAELLLREEKFAEAWSILQPGWTERRPPVLTPYVIRAMGGSDAEAARRLADELIESPPPNVIDAFSTLMAMSKSKVMKDRLYPYLNAIEAKYPSSQPIREFKANVLLRMGRFEQSARLGGTLDEPRRHRFQTKRLRALTKAIVKALWRRTTARFKGKEA